MTSRFAARLAPAVAAVMLSAAANAQCIVEHLTPPGVGHDNVVRADLSADGTVAVVGTPDDDTVAFQSGAAYVMVDNGGWTVAAVLIPPGVAEHTQAGRFVAISADGDRVLMDGWGAWVFRKTDGTWVFDSALTLDGETLSPKALSGDGSLAVASEPGNHPDHVYLFRHDANDWTLVQTIPTPDLATLGDPVTVSHDGSTLALIEGDDPDGPWTIRILVESDDGWGEQFVIPEPEGEHWRLASLELTPSGDRLVVGAGNVLNPDGTGGVVHVFDRRGRRWTLVDSLFASDPVWSYWSAPNSFGAHLDVSADGTRVLISDVSDSEVGIVSGAFYVFTHDGSEWVSGPKTFLADGTSGQGLGSSVAMSADGVTGVVGLSHAWAGGTPAQAIVYVLGDEDTDGDTIIDVCDNCVSTPNSDQHDCDEDGQGDVCAIETGAADCDGNDVPDVCDLTVVDKQAYALDDGSQETAIHVGGLSGVAWLNQFNVEPGGEVITAIDVAWGGVPEGSLATVLLWDDPDNDGDPADGVLIAAVDDVVVEYPFTYTFNRIPIPPTYVGPAGDSFFVGAHQGAQSFPDYYYMPADLYSPYQARSWYTTGDNLADLSDNIPKLTEHPAIGTWNLLVRAVIDLDPDCDGDGALDACQILDDPTLDTDADGILDACELPDLNLDGIVDGADLGILLANWGNAGEGDLNDDGVVDGVDLGLLLAAWGPS